MNRIEDVYGLTPVQEGIYAQYFRDKTTDAYHLYYLFSISQSTDLALLQQALRLLALRHPVMKTAFAVAKGVVKQVVLTDRIPKISTHTFDVAYTSDVLETAIQEEAALRFDLQADSLVRCTFFLFSDSRFLFLHTHHLILDGWCTSILFGDLTSYYNALVEGTSVDSLKGRIDAERSTQASFASYVNLVRQRDTHDAQLYWQTLLNNWKPVSLLKAQTPATRLQQIQRISMSVSPPIRQRIEAFARSLALPLNTVLETAFSLAIQKHAGSPDVVFHKAISGRAFGLSDIERTVGPMINTVPVRARRESGETLLDFLLQMNEQSIRANEYGFLPLSDVYRHSGIDPNTVDILFDFGNYIVPERNDTQPLSLLKQTEQTEFPLTCILSPGRNALYLTAIFDSLYFSTTQIQFLLDSFLFILEQITLLEKPQLDHSTSLLQLLRLTNSEQKLLFGAPEESGDFGGFSAGKQVPVPDKTIYELFSEQVKCVPEQPALLFKNQRIRFSELLQMIDKTADCLHDWGVGKQDVVAVHLERSPELIVYQLAVLKIGAIFLPVDKRFPKERLQFLCRDCCVRLFISDSDVSYLFDVEHITPSELQRCKARVSHTPACYVDNCYIIYTSGSTGTPKGCFLKQSSLINFCINNNTLASLQQNPRNVFACVNSVAFDYFIAESLFPLLNGYTVVLCDENESLRQNVFLELVAKHQINVLMTTPTRLSLFYDNHGDCSVLQTLNCVCTSGEPLTKPLLEKIYALSPHAIVFNPLGPSECTVWNLGGELSRDSGLDIHLGKPIANTQIYVLNEHLRPAPIGVSGELCIAGEGVGAGYLNRPELTKEKFVDNPFGEGKLYKTGDLVYWREDGNLVFVGRNDYQVKLNGQRVELGEIETALSTLNGIESSAVIVRKDEYDKQLLCAFYTGKVTDGTELRSLLSRFLPRYMVPQTFIHLDRMPLTTSGKIDRPALTSLPLPSSNEYTGFDAPKNETEQAICDAFAVVLGQKEISREASFFDLGGTSLQLVQLLSLSPLDVMTPSDFLIDPTPAGLAKKLDPAVETDYTYVVPLYTPRDAKGAVVLFPFAGGDASAYTALTAQARKTGSNLSLYFVDWPDEEKLSAITDEIRLLAAKTNVCFYSHCAGCSIAMMLLDQLNKETPCIRGYIAGASIPPRKALTGFNTWSHMSDRAIIKALANAGLQFKAEDATFLRERLDRFRLHTQICSTYFRRKTKKTNVTVTIVISKKDPFTPNFVDAKVRWCKEVTNVDQVILIDTPSHYFQNTDTGLLLNLFSELSF